MASGNVAVPLDHQLSTEKLADALNRADVDILFYSSLNEVVVNGTKNICPNVTEYYTLEQDKNIPSVQDIFDNTQYHGNTWSLKSDHKAPGADDLAMILFTSGTTGKSKGVMLSHKNLVGNALSQHLFENSIFDEFVILLILPLHHVFCINADILAMVHQGASICINGSISMLGKHLRMFEPTVLHIVPMITKVLYNKIKAMVSEKPGLTEKDALHIVYGRRLSRIICGGGGLPEDLAKKYLEMGIQIGQGYGMSECSPVISDPDFERPEKVSSAGKIRDHIEIRVADNGELQVRSPFVMKGYYKDPESTNGAFTEDGWLKTGDIGYIDDENYIFLTGRLKNLIILSNGENVSPEEIEEGFGSEPLVRDIIVFDEDDMIKCEVFPDIAYAKAAGIIDIEKAVDDIVHLHNAELPTYKRIMQSSIRELPFKKTTSNKIIRQAFFDERKNREKAEVVHSAPENEVQSDILAKVKKILPDIEQIGIDDNLYAHGLESLTTLELAVCLECSPTTIYENKTIRKISEKIAAKKGIDLKLINRNIKEKDINKYIDNADKLPFNASGAILVTGATGYLGSHIVKELCKKPNTVYCLIRKKERFEKTCEYYGVPSSNNIVPIIGDVTNTNFGLSDEQYLKLTKEVTAVYHVAASVSHAGDASDSYKINVGGTEEMIRFCEVSGAQLYHMSSYAVSGFGTDTPITEDVLDIDQQITQNPYILTKYQAEEKVLRARSKGVNSTIFRIGNLTKRALDGLFQINENESGLLSQFKAFGKLGAYPESMQNTIYDNTHVDLAAEAIIKLVENKGVGSIWHIMNPYFNHINQLTNARVVPDSVFRTLLVDYAHDRDVSMLAMYYRMKNDGFNTNFNFQKTVKELSALGFSWKVE